MKVPKILAISVALILLFSFTIHAIDFNHYHPPGAWLGIEAALHSMNRNLFAIVVLVMFALAFSQQLFTPLALLGRRVKRGLSEVVFDISCKLFDPLRIAFRRGVLHSQIY